MQVNCITPINIPEKPIATFSKNYIYVNYVPAGSYVEIYRNDGILVNSIYFSTDGHYKAEILKSGIYVVKVRNSKNSWTYKGVIR